MGWKNVKEHYKIGHIVQMTKEGLCIGSPYIHNIIVVDYDGDIKKSHDIGFCNDDLSRYQKEIESDPEVFKKLMKAPDTFERSIPVYTFSDDKIIEEHCEALGFPNVTHKGHVMYENRYSTNKDEVLEWALKRAESGVRVFSDHIEEVEKELQQQKERLAREREILENLQAIKKSGIV